MQVLSMPGFHRGINLGGWLSQCNDLTETYWDSFITKEDLLRIRDMGLDHVRLPVDYFLLEDQDANPLEKGYGHIDDCVRWCHAAGLHLLIDLHKAFGYTFDPVDNTEGRDNFFVNTALQDRFAALWTRIAKRYGGDEHIAFELLNEVVSPAVAEGWNQVAARTVREIRKVAPESWILIGGVRYNSVTSVPQLDPPQDDRIAYNFHCYEPMIFTHQRAYWVRNMPRDLSVSYPDTPAHYGELSKALSQDLAQDMASRETVSGPEFFERLFAPAISYATEQKVPLYCGEYGVIDQAPCEDTVRWLSDIHAVFEKHGIGRALWTYKDKDFGLIGPHYDSIRDRMIPLL
ncbi:MAG: glycoside hydrolase family 5 protein [Clostridia bacterium]|nr:glycoside hydrolase family 5 protein [Clostridia bacterium]